MSQIIKQELAKGKCPVEYGSTFEALNRYRRKGEQKVIVQHV